MVDKRFLLLLIIWVGHVWVLCAEATETKAEMANRWPDAGAVISRYETVIEFMVDKATKKPIIKKYDEVDIVPITEYSFSRICFYDNVSTISEPEILKNGTTRINYITNCGDWMSEDVFHDDMKYCEYLFSNKSNMDFIRFKTESQIKDLHFFAKSFLNDPVYPVSQRIFEVRVPHWIDIDILSFNFNYYNSTQTKVVKPDYTVYRYVVKDIPQINDLKYFKSPAYTFPHLLYQVKSYRDNSNVTHEVFANTVGFYLWLKNLNKDLVIKKDVLQPVVNDIVKSSKNRVDSIRSIYYWVQDNIRYIAFEYGLAGLIPEQADIVYEKKYGDCKGMASLLKAMLCLAGFDARLVWLGTNDLTYDFSHPNLAVGNHMICYLNDQGQDYYLDATQKMQSLGCNSDYIQGKQVMIENGNSCLLQTIPFSKASENAMITELDLDLTNDELIGNVKMCIKGNYKQAILSHLRQLKSTERNKFIYSYLLHNSKFSIDSLSYSSSDDRDSDFKIQFSINAKNMLFSVGTDYYVNLDLFSPNDWKTADTSNLYHLDMGLKSYSEIITRIKLPKTMKLVTHPSSVKFQSDPFSVEINCVNIESTIVYRRKSIIDTTIICKPDFKKFADFQKWNRNLKSQSMQLQLVSSNK